MIEGEGTISHYPQHDHNAALISVTSTSIETIATLLRLVGAGRIIFQEARLPNRKDAWRWTITRSNDLVALGQQIRPYLTDKSENLKGLFADIVAREERKRDLTIRWNQSKLEDADG